MKAVSTDALAHGPNWIHEVKWDGFRLVVTITDGRVVARTASGRDLTEALPELEQMATSLGAEVILDGELVVPDATGRPDFSLVQRRFGRGVGDATGAATFVAFDLLHLGGRDTMGLELRDRRRILESLWVSGEAWTLSPWYEAGEPLFDEMARRGMEGVVSKRLDSVYQEGRRSSDWHKTKARRRQEFVVGGWLPGDGHLSGELGSLLLGVYDGAALRYAGRVGSGLTAADRSALRNELTASATDGCPFSTDPGTSPPRDVVRSARWCRPTVVADVTFAEWTAEGRLRHPVFVARRFDADPASVVREP